MFEIASLGIINSDFKEPADPFEMVKHDSIIIIDEEYKEALYNLENNEYIEVYFYFHKSNRAKNKIITNYFGERKGIFAARSPIRFNNIGMTPVKLNKIENNKLFVTGLDAVDGTPVIDIKPCSDYLSKFDIEKNNKNRFLKNPRIDFIPLIKNNDLESLMIKAGELHGHFCPGLSFGVKAGVYAMNIVQNYSDGLEDLVSVIEVNNCFLDGIQVVTGCSIGNNSMIYRDFGKTAFSLCTRDKKGVRLALRPDFHDKLKKEFPVFSKLFNEVVVNNNRDLNVVKDFKRSAQEASFKILRYDIEDVFDIQEVTVDIPEYAPIRENKECSICHETAMDTKMLTRDSENICKFCANEFFQVDGRGIVGINS